MNEFESEYIVSNKKTKMYNISKRVQQGIPFFSYSINVALVEPSPHGEVYIRVQGY
jgi:hypothetical protein